MIPYIFEGMAFNTVHYLLFFSLITFIYLAVPRKLRQIWLLLSSLFFYLSWNPHFLLYISISTITSYFCALAIERYNIEKNPAAGKFLIVANLTVNLGLLCYFKYANFALESIDSFLQLLNLGTLDKRLDLLLPIGISFYTFQIIGYTIDVYRGQSKAEHNIVRYAVFVFFFPKIVCGPIERTDNLLAQLTQLENKALWDLNRIRDGLLLMAWGYFQKLVIADRLSILTGPIFDHYSEFGSVELLMAIILFAFQIYCDFAGYTDIARGAAQIMGLSLLRNFRQPYLATGIRDFWKRWHISLTSWFTSYLYIPLGGNRKGLRRKWINIVIVFLVSGLWHGASWHFVVWGGLHALYQIAEDRKRIRSRKNQIQESKEGGRCRNVLAIVKTFIVVDFAWLFFAAHGTKHAFKMIAHALSLSPLKGFGSIAYGPEDWIILFMALLILFLVDVCHEKGLSVRAAVSQWLPPFRWVVYIGLIWSVIMLGIYGQAYDAGGFLYAQF